MQKSAQTRQSVLSSMGELNKENLTRETRERKPVKGKSVKSETGKFETEQCRVGKKKCNKSFVKIMMIMKL